MPCDDYNKLMEERNRADLAEVRAHTQSVQAFSMKDLVESRRRTTSARERLESEIEMHIADCKQCSAEGIKAVKSPRP
jgi:hypothetical protein